MSDPATRRLALLLALALAGCAPTLAEIRSGPAQTATFAGQYDTVTLCLMDKIDSQGGLFNRLQGVVTHYVDRRTEQTATLSGSGGTFVIAGPLLFDITTTQVTPSMLRVAMWSRANFDRSLWPLVDACAGEKVVTSPPRQE